MALFHFVTELEVAAPPERVWEVIEKPSAWPTWWHWLRSVEVLEPHSDLATVPDDADLDALDLHGFAADAADELFAAAAPEQGDAEARDALRLLHRLVTP